jgi:hypothetical protein
VKCSNVLQFCQGNGTSDEPIQSATELGDWEKKMEALVHWMISYMVHSRISVYHVKMSTQYDAAMAENGNYSATPSVIDRDS